MPDLVYLLAVLACPIVMGAMMLLMMHGRRPPVDGGDEVARLRAEVDQLRSQRSGGSSSTDQASAG